MPDKPLVPLENCPLCGGEAVLENNVMNAVIRCFKCKLCLARKHSAKKDTGIDDAIKAWNTRAQKPLDMEWPERKDFNKYFPQYLEYDKGFNHALMQCKDAYTEALIKNHSCSESISEEEIANLIMDINFENYGFSHEEVALKTAQAIVQALKKEKS